MVVKVENTFVTMREKYGWKLYKNNNIRLWFCGHLYYKDIENIFSGVEFIEKNTEKLSVLRWISGLNGHFSFVVEHDSFVIASVDKICSIPLFTHVSNSLFISNHAPILKESCSLDSNYLDNNAKLEIEMSGYTIGRKTLYKGIDRLESGECIFVYKNNLYRDYYYTYSPWNTRSSGELQLQKEFIDIFLEILREIKRSAVNRQIVVPLSAGNDSRLIVSGLKEVGVRNVVCFSYGRRGNFETPIGEDIAKKLGYKWIYIPDRLKDKRHFFQSKIYHKYVDEFESFAHTTSIQEVYEIFLLKKTNLIDDNAIIINGSCGDFISGGHIRSISSSGKKIKYMNQIDWSKFLDKHYTLWEDLRTPKNEGYIISKLESLFSERVKESVDINKHHYAIMESMEFNGRQSKIVIGQQRAYEYFGYEWRMPLWSDEMLNFWEGVPYNNKVDQSLYLSSLYSRNLGGVWLDIKVNNKKINPIYLRWLRILLKTFFIPLGKSRWHRFEKNILDYFLHPSYALAITSYLSVLLDRRGYRGANSWLSHKMIRSKYIVKK